MTREQGREAMTQWWKTTGHEYAETIEEVGARLVKHAAILRTLANCLKADDIDDARKLATLTAGNLEADAASIGKIALTIDDMADIEIALAGRAQA